MVDWRDKGILLKARPYGDSSFVAHFLTEEHGRFAGLTRATKSAKNDLQIGTLSDLHWTARLDDQLGFYHCEAERSIAPRVLDDPLRLLALTSTMDLIDKTLPERDRADGVFQACKVWIDMLEGELWGETLVHLELGLLAHLGFGLDLSTCAVTGMPENLAFVSPKSGKAVSKHAAGPYKARLLPLPGFLGETGATGVEEVIKGLNLTGYFLHHRFFAATNRGLPAERLRLVDELSEAE